MPFILTTPHPEGARPLLATISRIDPEPLNGGFEVTVALEGGRGSITYNAPDAASLPGGVGESFGLALASVADCKLALAHGAPQAEPEAPVEADPTAETPTPAGTEVKPPAAPAPQATTAPAQTAAVTPAASVAPTIAPTGAAATPPPVAPTPEAPATTAPATPATPPAAGPAS